MDQGLGLRQFSLADQESFAALSGDRNPIHLDEAAARRSLAKQPIVHGVHLLLWCLESLVRDVGSLPPIAGMKVNFEKTLAVGAEVRALLAQRDAERALIRAQDDKGVVMTAILSFGAPSQAQAKPERPLISAPEPLAPTLDEIAGAQGRVASFCSIEAASRLFPGVAHALGGDRICGLLCATFLVGMVCPGLHSMFRSLNFVATEGGDDAQRLDFLVSRVDARFRLARLNVAGAGWAGAIDAHIRPEPVPQPSIAHIAERIAPGEFSGARALVVGGSRGLGELVGKILAAGGASVTLTYCVCEADGRRVLSEIAAHGGRADIMRYDVRESCEPQVRALPQEPNQLYYMATPAITPRRGGGFDRKLLDDYLRYYVDGFYDLCRALSARANGDLRALYPSTAYLDARPEALTEYVMAKAAGETLCADIQNIERLASVLSVRLPRLLTDQTVSLTEEKFTDAVEAFLPLIRQVNSNLRS
jgi:hypothetical protein